MTLLIASESDFWNTASSIPGAGFSLLKSKNTDQVRAIVRDLLNEHRPWEIGMFVVQSTFAVTTRRAAATVEVIFVLFRPEKDNFELSLIISQT